MSQRSMISTPGRRSFQTGDNGTNRPKGFRRSSLMALSQKPLNVSTRLVDSYKAAIGGLEETENKKAVVLPDEMGEHLTFLLNANPAFQWQPPKDDDNGLDCLQWPLLSWHNWNLLTCGLGKIRQIRWTSIPNDALQFYRNTTKFLFLNSKSFQGTAMLNFGLTIVSLGILTTSITIATICSSWLLWAFIWNILTMLVDLEEFRKICPERLTKLFHQLIPFFQWVDRIVLQGKRTAGREWNKDEFEMGDAQQAESLGFSLWDLPPPSIKEGKRLCINEDYMARDQWGQTTTKHVVAINFCYIMLHEEFLRKQASRRKKMFPESRSDPDPSIIYQQHGGSSGDGGGLMTSVHTRTSWSRGGGGLMLEDVGEEAEDFTHDQGLQRGTDSPAIITSISEAHQHTMLSTRRASSLTCSPAEAIEVTRDRVPHFFGSSPNANCEIGVTEDFGLSGINDFLSVDTSSSSSSSSAHAASQDLNMSSDNSFESATTDHVGNWMDVGAEIGLKILGSAHVQRAMASKETAERIKETMEMQLGKRKAAQINANIAAAVPGLLDEDVLLGGNESVDTEEVEKPRLPPPVPFHPMWTSAAAAATNTSLLSLGSYSDQEETSSLYGGELQSQEAAVGEDHSLDGLLSGRRKSSERNKSKRKKNRASKIGKFFRDKLHRRSPSEINDHAEGSLGSLYASVSHRGKHSRRRSSLSASREAEAIEVVCGGKPDVTPKTTSFRVPVLLPGIKVVVPIFPIQPGLIPLNKIHDSRFQMGTVVSSQRIFVPSTNNQRGESSSASGNSGRTNCLSLTVKLDKSFLRNGEFAEMTIRIMDAWGPRYVPKHSKLPIGSCVATSFGLGVLVGWRVEDDCHVIRSLWQRRGPGSACAYLRRDSIHATVEAAVGFEVGTPFGEGKVVAYVDGKRDYRSGRFFVVMKEDGRHKGKVLEFNRSDITSCHSARFIPIIELIREAAQYQLQVDNYEAALREREGTISRMPKPADIWRAFPKYADILWKSFLRAIEEDSNFDEGLNHFMTSIINFLERLDRPTDVQERPNYDEQNIVITSTEESNSSKMSEIEQKPGFWIMNDMFGGIFSRKEKVVAADDADDMKTEIEVEMHDPEKPSKGPTSIDRAFSVIRTMMRTVSIARAGCVNEPNFKLGLSICYEFLIFIKTVVKVQQKNVSPKSLAVWKRAWQEIVSTFGPVKERLEKIGKGIAERMEKQGKRAKIRLLRFADTIVKDDSLLIAMEQGDWDRCAVQLELAMVKAKIIDEENREHYHKTAQFVYGHFAFASARSSKNAAPKEKLAHLAKMVQWIAAPRRSLLKLFMLDGVLNALERIFVRVFHKEEEVSRMLAIHASTFSTLRHFRMLKDFTIAGKLWIPLLDAADAEFSWVVSRMPENTKYLMSPLAKLFSLCVVQFHKISQGDLTKDWLDFLLEEEAVNIIHEINMKLILSLESFSREIKEMMVVLPYYPSIEDDILNLMDEVDLDEFLKEAADAIEDADKLSEFIREKAVIAIERFLDYLPKMSIPVEKRDLGDGWMLTCRGADGGDLTLSDVNIKRENLICQVMGGDTIFFPMLGIEDDAGCSSPVHMSSATVATTERGKVESSILDHIRELLLQAQRYGCWQVGIGGVGQPPSDRYVASVLNGLPVSIVLNTAIELWRNLEIDDDELLEIAIRDVSYQIQLQQEREENDRNSPFSEASECDAPPPAKASQPPGQFKTSRNSDSFETHRHRFNPRVDPTVLFLEMKKLTLHLEGFQFCIEKHEDFRTVFDPVFEGCGSLAVQNVSIKLSVECVKERVKRMGSEVSVPLLQLRELDVQLEKVMLNVRDTGADWLLNKVVKGFSDKITSILASNLKEQVRDQLNIAIQNVNSYCEVNPDVMLGLLGITMDDLEEKVVWV